MTTVVRIKVKPNRAAGRGSNDKQSGREERLHAHAVKRIYDRHTGEHVGWLYEWNTGDLIPRWTAAPHSDVFYG